jgi:Domain of unknown function (DUF6566)
MPASRGNRLLDSSGKGLGVGEQEMNYKNHRIEVSVRSVNDGSGWKPDVYVTYNENGKNVLKSLRIDPTFATPDEAEQSGVEYAKKWIDDGKPDPSL